MSKIVTKDKIIPTIYQMLAEYDFNLIGDMELYMYRLESTDIDDILEVIDKDGLGMNVDVRSKMADIGMTVLKVGKQSSSPDTYLIRRNEGLMTNRMYNISTDKYCTKEYPSLKRVCQAFTTNVVKCVNLGKLINKI